MTHKTLVLVLASLSSMAVAVFFALLKTEPDVTRASDLVLRATVANQAWLEAAERGETIQLVDIVFEEGSAAGTSFVVPDDSTHEIRMQFPIGGSLKFCSSMYADDRQIQHSYLEPDTDTLVSVDDLTGEKRSLSPSGLPGSPSDLRASIQQAIDEAAALSEESLILGDESLGRSANVVIVPAAEDDVRISPRTAPRTIERRVYFDEDSGEQFASERWQVEEGADPVLLYRRVRSIETNDSALDC